VLRHAPVSDGRPNPRLPHGEPSIALAVADRASRQPLHDEQAQALVVHEVVDRHDVRVVEAGQEPRLFLEPRLHGGIGGEGLGQLLYRDGAPEPAVPRRQDHAPCPPPELLLDSAARQPGSAAATRSRSPFSIRIPASCPHTPYRHAAQTVQAPLIGHMAQNTGAA
jgi:hypothetical protein